MLRMHKLNHDTRRGEETITGRQFVLYNLRKTGKMQKQKRRRNYKHAAEKYEGYQTGVKSLKQGDVGGKNE